MHTVELSVESGDGLDVRSLHVVENMSASFRLDVRARAREDALDLAGMIGKRASLRLRDDLGTRAWTGVCAQAAQIGVESRGLSTYTLRIVPALWLLTHRRGHRLFQGLSVPEIVGKILGEWGIQPVLELRHAYPKLPSRTQYGESDYDFVRRLLAEAGASFFFHGRGGEETRVVLSDAPEAAAPRPDAIPFQASLPASISNVNISSHVVPSRVTFVDQDFRRPRYALAGTHAVAPAEDALLERYHYAPGHSLGEARDGAAEPMADGRGVYRHADHLAQEHAQRRAEGHRASQTRVGFATSCLDLSPGTVFSIEGHPHPEVAAGKRLLVTHAWLQGDVGAAGWRAGGRAVPADKPFRPAVEHRNGAGPSPDPFEPLQHTAKPRVFGAESAIVTGPPGADVHTDEHGRVTVQFPWDREGKLDEKSSPWVRVSQAWAGPGYGVHTIPRVGHEVLVAFHDGDPDHPVVVGRVHNAAAPVPYALPEHKMRTSIRTSADAGSGGSANEITFDDAKGQVLFYMQAAEDLHKIVQHDELELTQGSRSLHVDGDLTISAGGTMTFLAGKDIVVKGGPVVSLNPKDPPQPAKKPPVLKKSKTPSTGGVPVAPPKPAKKPPKKPSPKGTNAAAEARKFLYKYETQLQAEGVTLPCPTNESCANFVSSMLARVGAIHDSSRTLNVGDLSETLQSTYHWKKVSPADAKPGDVWIVDQSPSPPGEQHTEIVAGNDDGHITLIGSNNHPVDSNQQVNYDASSANAGMADSYILAPP